MTHAFAPFVPRTVAVLGAGAVGSYFGAKLARAGLDVTLIGRPATSPRSSATACA